MAKSWPKLSKSEEDEVIIPTLEPGENLKLESVYSVKAPHQRPPRFGVGRFVSTLFKMGLVRPSTMDQIVEKLVDKHYITIQSKMIVPTKLGKRVDAWMSLELPEINSIENAVAFESKIEALEDEEEANNLIKEYHELVFGLLGRKGVFYKKTKNDFSDNQINYVKRLAAQTGVILEESFFKNGENVAKFITDCHNALSLGKCPSCKKGLVLEHEKVYACNNKQMNCKFMIHKENGLRFFEYYGKRVDEDFVKDVIKSALNFKPVAVELISPKKGTTMTPYIILESTKPPYWNFGLQFKK